MVKHTRVIRQLLPTNRLGVFDHFLGLLLKVLKKDYKKFNPLVSGVHPKVIDL